MLKKIQETVKYIQEQTDIAPKIGIVLGTGLANFTSQIKIADTIPYGNIPNFPVSTVKGHHGQLIFGHIHNIPVVALKGRFHNILLQCCLIYFYIFHGFQIIVFP